MISVLRQHLSLIFNARKEPFKRNSLELVHLVESTRYRKNNLRAPLKTPISKIHIQCFQLVVKPNFKKT